MNPMSKRYRILQLVALVMLVLIAGGAYTINKHTINGKLKGDRVLQSFMEKKPREETNKVVYSVKRIVRCGGFPTDPRIEVGEAASYTQRGDVLYIHQNITATRCSNIKIYTKKDGENLIIEEWDKGKGCRCPACYNIEIKVIKPRGNIIVRWLYPIKEQINEMAIQTNK